MTWVAVAVAGAAVVGAGASYLAADRSASAAESASQNQLRATTQGQDLLREMYNKNAPYWYPYTTVGQQGATQINQMLPYLTHRFSPTDLQTGLAPNYQFMLGQGRQAQQQTMNVGGGGSNISRAADIFSQNYAQNAYQNAFTNFRNQRNDIYNTLQSIAGIGQQGAAGLSNLGSGVATNISNLGIQGANAQAAGQIGQANAWSGAISNIGNTLGNAGMSYALLNPNRGTDYGPNGNLPYQTNNASDTVYPGSNFDVSQGTYGPYAQ